MGELNPQVLILANRIADRLMAEGARAVMLTGSHVRGDAHRESDVDIIAIGEGPPYRLHREDGALVSISWQTAEGIAEALRQPAQIGGLVPGLRGALVLRDPAGAAAALQQTARDWTWESIREESRRTIAEAITGWAEEVHKLVACLESGRATAGAVQRSLLAIYLAPVLTVHHQIFYDSENALWDRVNERMGDEWAAAQASAFALNGETYEESCRAALKLYTLAAREVGPLLDERQRAVVEHACALARSYERS